jgi:spermidine synthase
MSKNDNVSKLPKWLFLLILVCFFFSGMTGLIYQVIWTRMVVKVIGAAPFAISIILTVFMGGLGIGSYLASRHIDKIKDTVKLIKIYGFLELIIGAYCLILPLLLTLFKPLYAIFYNQLFQSFWIYNFLTFIFCGIILILPVICMGATLPLLCRFYVSNLSHMGAHVGRLYGLNTIGAAVGALITGFWLIETIGVNCTLGMAVAINVVIGVVCVVVAGKVVGQYTVATSHKKNIGAKTTTDSERTAEDISTRKTLRFISLLIFAVSGFCSMSYEVIWTKLLGLIIGPTTYSFSIVLVTFITGLALGSILFGWIVDRVKKPVMLLIYTQVIAAAIALVVTHYMGNSQFFYAKLIYTYQDNFLLLNLLKGGSLFCFMLLPTICLGATFPIVGKIYTESVNDVGNAIGFSYAINTLGAVLGSFTAGFILVPFVGKENGMKLVVLLQMAVACFVVIAMVRVQKKHFLGWSGAFIVAIIGLFLCNIYPKWDRDSLSLGRYHRTEKMKDVFSKVGWFEAFYDGQKIFEGQQQGEVVYYGDGLTGFTTVMEFNDIYGNKDYNIVVSGKPDASTRTDMPTQSLSAHIPLLIHPNPKSVMVLGLASGVTSCEALLYDLERLDVLEISKEVVVGSDYFRPWNHDVLDDPVTELIIQDGRAHLQLTDRIYDVIISEPSNPWMAGLSALFTADYFSAAKEKLTVDGIFAQFIHSYQMDWNSYVMVCRTFSSVFDNAMLVRTKQGDYLMIGFKNTKGIYSQENIQSHLKHAQQSKNIEILNGESMFSFIVTSDLKGFAGEGLIHSDQNPYLEFAAPKAMHGQDANIEKALANNRYLSNDVKLHVWKISNNVDLQLDVFEMQLSVNNFLYNQVNWAKTTQDQKNRYVKLVSEYASHREINKIEHLPNDTIKQIIRKTQIDCILANITPKVNKTLAYYTVGDLFLANRNYKKAQHYYTKTLALKKDHAELYNDLATTYHYQKQFREAIKLYDKALELKPGFDNAENNRQKAVLSLKSRK